MAQSTKFRILPKYIIYLWDITLGIDEYENIISDSEGYYRGLFELFIKTIIHDSKKHLMILEYLERHLKED